ncbi:MAG: hypothetical protein JO356_10900 [Acidobacteria bacterium]|nr:hypothetical protein [Acidobacteriota bacterium]
MSASIRLTVLSFGFMVTAMAQQPPHGHDGQPSATMMTHPSPTPTASASYTELKNTVSQLERARQATAKYQDVRVAEAEGYRPLGPDIPGMGLHFVQTLEVKQFNVEKPPILLYNKDAAVPGGYSLVAVSYLWNAAEGPDGQPLDPPFPKSLARWHRHENVCLLSGLANPHGLSENQCREQGGHFVAQAPWMVHAWIWKDNPAGVFTPENPALR